MYMILVEHAYVISCLFFSSTQIFVSGLVSKSDHSTILSGYSLFLVLVIDRLHQYIRDLRGFKKNLEAVSKHNKVLEEAKLGISKETEKYQEEIATLNKEMKKLKIQVQEKTEEIHVAEDKALAIQKQSEGLLIEYDHLLEDNQHLRIQLQSIDLRLSSSS